MKPINILIIDDEPANVQVLFAALRNMGKVQFATTGKKALEIANQTIPNVVLLDYSMPELDGFHVCKALKSDPRLSQA